MPHFIAMLNFKGGTGKTTSCVNLAAALAATGRRVCLVDMDAQHNLTQSFGVDEPAETVYHALISKKPLPIVELSPGLWLAPNGLEMIKFDIEVAATVRREYLLRASLSKHLPNFDYFIFDCPPSLSLATANALFAADAVAVFVPVQAEFLALKGFSILSDALEGLGMEIGRCFVTRYDKRKVLNRSVLDALHGAMAGKMFATCIRENIALAESPANGGHIFATSPSSTGASDYNALALETIQFFETQNA